MGQTGYVRVFKYFFSMDKCWQVATQTRLIVSFLFNICTIKYDLEGNYISRCFCFISLGLYSLLSFLHELLYRLPLGYPLHVTKTLSFHSVLTKQCDASTGSFPGFGNRGSTLRIYEIMGVKKSVTQFARIIIPTLYIDIARQSLLFYIIQLHIVLYQ